MDDWDVDALCDDIENNRLAKLETNRSERARVTEFGSEAMKMPRQIKLKDGGVTCKSLTITGLLYVAYFP